MQKQLLLSILTKLCRWLVVPIALSVTVLSNTAFAISENATETITLNNNQVILVNLNEPVEPNHSASLSYSEASSNDLIGRLRNGFSLNTDANEERLLRQKRLLNGKQEYLDRVLARAQRNLYLSVSEAERRQLPTELALLPVIESAYDPMATSRSQAAGLWQFIPDTGRLFGLEQSWYYDARRDPLASTQAAYDYLSSLNDSFKSWELALAAYNAGPGTVSRAIKRNRALGLPTDYWSLKLPAETMAYVPRFLAIAALFKSPDNFNVHLASIPNRPYFRTVATPTAMTFNEVAGLTGLSLQVIRELNPALRRDGNAPNGPYQWHLPASLDVAMENLLMQSAGGTRVLVAKSSDSRTTDSFIATPYKSGSDLATAESARYTTQTSEVRNDLIQVSDKPSDARIELRRRVVKGDTLASLARQYQLSLAELRAWNGSVQTLQVGQELILRVLPSVLNSKAL